MTPIGESAKFKFDVPRLRRIEEKAIGKIGRFNFSASVVGPILAWRVWGLYLRRHMMCFKLYRGTFYKAYESHHYDVSRLIATS